MENYHTHTFRCKHAIGDVEDYVRVAKEKGFTGLGMSDHTPLEDRWWDNIRMEMEQLEDYVQHVYAMQKANLDFPILLGMECDCSKRYESFYKEEYLGHYQMDYLIGSVHGYEYEGEAIGFYGAPIDHKKMAAYAKQYARAIEAGIYTFMGHPDLFGLALTRWDEEIAACSKYIIEAAAYYQVPLEMNCSGLAKKGIKKETVLCYPLEPFWKMVSDYPVKVLINSDAHDPLALDMYLNEGYQLAEKLGLEIISLPQYLKRK